MMRGLFALLLVFWAAGVLAAPSRIGAEYSLRRNGQEVAQVVETFTQSRGQYRIESVTQAVGVYRLLSRDSIRFLSQGRVTRTGLQPVHFEHHRGSHEDKKIIADFDWKTKTGRFHHDGETETLPLPAGLQDRLSLMYQFMFLAVDGPSLSLHMSNGRKITRYEYRRVGEEEIDTPAGRFRTLHLTRVREPGDDGTDVWLALDRHRMPVKVVIDEEKGGRMEQVLTRLTVQ